MCLCVCVSVSSLHITPTTTHPATYIYTPHHTHTPPSRDPLSRKFPFCDTQSSSAQVTPPPVFPPPQRQRKALLPPPPLTHTHTHLIFPPPFPVSFATQLPLPSPPFFFPSFSSLSFEPRPFFSSSNQPPLSHSTFKHANTNNPEVPRTRKQRKQILRVPINCSQSQASYNKTMTVWTELCTTPEKTTTQKERDKNFAVVCLFLVFDCLAYKVLTRITKKRKNIPSRTRGRQQQQ